MRNIMWLFVGAICVLVLVGRAEAKHKTTKEDSTEDYIRRMQAATAESTPAPSGGSLWRDNGELSNIASDYKAHLVGDIVVISIVEQTLAQASGTVATQRTFKATSGIAGLAGRISTGGVNPLIESNSDAQLKGQGQTASTSSLRTSLAGQVLVVLPNGNLVVEAKREVLMNNERQTIWLRGVARPGDLGANNSVLSTQLSNLEVELKGKGVISEGTRQPNFAIRILMRLLTF